MSHVHVIITFEAKPEAAAPCAELLEQAARALPKASGCHSARLFAATAAPIWTLMEEWDSEAAHRQHLERVVASGAWEQLAAHLAQPPISHYYSAT